MRRVDVIQYSREYSLTPEEVNQAIKEFLEEAHAVYLDDKYIQVIAEDGSCIITSIGHIEEKEVKDAKAHS